MSGTVTIAGIAFGVPIIVRVNGLRWLKQVTAYLPFGWRGGAADPAARVYSLQLADDGPEGAGACSVRVDDSPVVERAPLPVALRRFESHARLHVAEMAAGHLFVHAGVVAYRERAIVLPGKSLSGKSTLVAELLKAGAEYYSDEYAVFDAEGRVHPYAAPLSIRNPDGRTAEKVSVAALGASAGRAPVPVGVVLGCRYRPDASWQPTPASLGQGVLLLIANTVAALRVPEFALVTLTKAVAGARIFFSDRSEAEAAAKCILGLTVCLDDAGIR